MWRLWVDHPTFQPRKFNYQPAALPRTEKEKSVMPDKSALIEFGKVFGYPALLAAAAMWFGINQINAYQVQTKERLTAQDQKIDKQEDFIRTELIDITQEVTQALEKNTAALVRLGER